MVITGHQPEQDFLTNLHTFVFPNPKNFSKKHSLFAVNYEFLLAKTHLLFNLRCHMKLFGTGYIRAFAIYILVFFCSLNLETAISCVLFIELLCTGWYLIVYIT